MPMNSTQTKREQAVSLLTELFRDKNRILISDAMVAAKERGLSRRTMLRGCAEMGITTISNGPFGGIWTTDAP